MENKNDILSEIEKIAPGLTAVEKKNSFETPADYFDDLSSSIQEKVRMQSSKNQKTVIAWLKYPQIAIATSLIVIMVIGFFYLDNSKQKQFTETNVIYWDEILNDNTIIDKVEEYQLVDAYIELTDNENKEDALEAESNELESEMSNDVFTEI
jgi:hypothetical protein